MASKSKIIRILESDVNRRGDLFGRLMQDLFLSLGYETARLNIAKSGREIDLQAEHRTESRRVYAECKATSDPVGGNDVNKFFGALDIERSKSAQSDCVGYFISLSGFTETAIEQENETGKRRLVLLNGSQVIDQLITGNIIVSEARACEIAGRCASSVGDGLKISFPSEIVAHELGWVWIVYFGSAKEVTHFSLIHADGSPLGENVARNLIEADGANGGDLRGLTYLVPASSTLGREAMDRAKRKYFEFLARECGEIQLEGLPADQEVGSRRLRIENIFVPLNAVRISATAATGTGEQLELSGGKKRRVKRPTPRRTPIGKILRQFRRVAMLGLPGGGKSTLLKRIAIAYAFPDRRNQIADHLPNRNWLPLFIRCRQLDSLVLAPITQILHELHGRTELDPELQPAFKAFISEALRNGNALLLIDGLDEISDEGARLAFVKQLRTFLATYPGVGLVLTSREAGFRIIGGALAAQCEHFTLSEFNDKDIERLSVAWHREVVGDKPDVVTDAKKLAQSICNTDRVRRLAQNPLLLTTLLLVKRWVGQLPTRRSVLYGKAVEVLLMTWNVEGHEPLDPEEVLPQLEFVAYSMMKEGVQRVSLVRLREMLVAARSQMPEILGFSRVSVADFIERVELRSSLLMLSGHEIEGGTLTPVYEFRHLTFQEYLTAKAIVEGHYPGHRETDTLLGMLSDHMLDESWEEVVLLSSVLAGGRKIQPLIQHLISECKQLDRFALRHEQGKTNPANMLAKCVIDEIQLTPQLLDESLKWIVRKSDYPNPARVISQGRYGDVFKAVALRELSTATDDFLGIGGTVLELTAEELGWPSGEPGDPTIHQMLSSDSWIEKCRACLAFIQLAFHVANTHEEEPTKLKEVVSEFASVVYPLMGAPQPFLKFAATWAVVWTLKAGVLGPNPPEYIGQQLGKFWQTEKNADMSYVSGWGISWFPVKSRDRSPFGTVDRAFVSNMLSRPPEQRQSIRRRWNVNRGASLVMCYYCPGIIEDDELIATLKESSEPVPRNELLKQLGVTVDDDPK